MWNRVIHDKDLFIWINIEYKADLEELVERKARYLVVMYSSLMVAVN